MTQKESLPYLSYSRVRLELLSSLKFYVSLGKVVSGASGRPAAPQKKAGRKHGPSRGKKIFMWLPGRNTRPLLTKYGTMIVSFDSEYVDVIVIDEGKVPLFVAHPRSV